METLFTSLSAYFESYKLSPLLSASAARVGLLILALLVAFLVNQIARRGIIRLISYLIKSTATTIDDSLIKRGVFHRFAYIAPILVLYGAIPVVFPDLPSIAEVLQRGAMAVIILIAVITVDALLDVAYDVYQTLSVSRDRPIKSLVQLLNVFLYSIGLILILATLLNKSPWAFLSGLGAMTAIIMLVFKDSILGFVASIQLAAQNMVRPGDWIEMNKYGADGDVIDVTLNTVKVQNWDKTITMIPTYALISDSFKNWRGMQESDGRRMKRSISIDINTIGFCSDEQLERFSAIQLLKPYLDERTKEIGDYNQEKDISEDARINGRRLTNIGVFRKYCELYLESLPDINQDMTFLVRQLAPTEKGLPIELYVFSSDKRWARYEEIQADIFDHLLAAVPEFDLAVYQSPSSRDVINLKQ